MDEREFLHNLVNPLAIGMGNAKLLMKKLTTKPEEATSEAMFHTLTTIFESFERMKVMIDERRRAIYPEDQKK